MPTVELEIAPSLPADRVTEILNAQAQWAKLADEADREANWVTETLAGRPNTFGFSSPDALRNSAVQYRAVVRSFDLELATGKAHCACCLKPTSVHRR